MSVGIGLGDVCIVLRGAFTMWAGVRAYSEDTGTIREEISLWKLRLEELDQRVRDANISPGAARMAKRHLLESFKTLEKIEKYLCAPATKGSAHLKWAVYQRNKVMRYKENLNALMSRIAEMMIALLWYRQTALLLYHLPSSRRSQSFWWMRWMKWFFFRRLFARTSRFKLSKVASWMEQRRYEITNEATGTKLSSDVHGNIVKPGMRLSMAMMLFLEKEPTRQSQHECPKWGKCYEGDTSGVLERVQCEQCQTTFQVSLEPRIIEIDNTNKNTRDENTLKVQTAGASAVDYRDIGLFRRLHVLLRELHERAELAPISKLISTRNHILRAHIRPISCIRCGLFFDKAYELNHHIKSLCARVARQAVDRNPDRVRIESADRMNRIESADRINSCRSLSEIQAELDSRSWRYDYVDSTNNLHLLRSTNSGDQPVALLPTESDFIDDPIFSASVEFPTG